MTYTENQINDYNPAITSDQFVYNNRNVFIQDNGTGRLNIVQLIDNNISIITRNIGTVNYKTGEVNINSLSIQDYSGDSIRFTANLVNRDIIAPKDRIVKIRSNDITVNVLGRRQ